MATLSLHDLRRLLFGVDSNTESLTAAEQQALYAFYSQDITIPDLASGNLPRDLSFKGWSYDPIRCNGTLLTAGGSQYLTKILLREAITVSTIHWGVGLIAVLPTVGQNHVGLYNSSGTRLATAAVESVTTSAGRKDTSITPVGVGPGFCWVAMLFNGVTNPAVAKSGSFVSAAFQNGLLTAASARGAINGTGKTTLDASITPGNNVMQQDMLWAAVS